MASNVFYIWWDEFDRHDMPCVCVICGRKKAKWVGYKFHTTRYEYMRNWRVTRKTEVPLCSEHSGGWLTTLHARDFDKQGVWVLKPHDDFIDALKKHRKEEIKEFKEEMEDKDLDDFDEHELPPGMRTPPPEPRTTVGQYLTLILAGAVLLVVAVGFVVVCLCMGLIPALGIGAGAAGRR
jgi:hypothetical protein